MEEENMNAAELTVMYYEMCLGYIPDEDTSTNKTKATINYLKDNKYTDTEIRKIFLDVGQKEILTADDLPSYLWEDSLIKRNEFYYHHNLQIKSPAPYFDIISKKEIMFPYYLEIKIKYTVTDVYQYFLSKTAVPSIDSKRDKGAIQKMIKTYNINGIKGLDFILSLIDESRFSQDRIFNLWDIQRYESIVYDKLLRNIAEAKSMGKDKIIWRS